MKKIALLCGVLLFALLWDSNFFSEASGRTLYVNSTDPSCGGKLPCYKTIQAAVTAAYRADLVQIQAGTYTEQLNVDGKNNFAGATEASRIVIEADPALPPGSVTLHPPPASCLNGQGVLIRRSKFVTLRGLTITGAVGAGVVVLGGLQQNQAIHIERSRIFGNSRPNCPGGGIAIALGNPDTLILNTLIYGNAGNGITFADPSGGPHWIIQNTIHGNGWNGVGLVLGQTVALANNLITNNGQASGTLGGRYGISRIALPKQSPEAVQLLNNLICGNRLGEIDGPMLDDGDAENLTPQGSEGEGVKGSPGCQIPENVYANTNGADGIANSLDDDFTLAQHSPAIDRGTDPLSLGLNIEFDVLLASDFKSEFARPSDANGDRILGFDIGALELRNEPPIADAEPDQTTFRGVLVTLNGNRSYDPEGAALAYRWSILSQPANTKILLSNPTSPTQQFTPLVRGNYVLQLVVNDGQLDSAPDNVQVNVVNSVPTASGRAINTNEDTPVEITLNAVDLDDTALTFAIVDGPSSGTLSAISKPNCVADGAGSSCAVTLTYAPAAESYGSDSFTFKVNDGSADSNVATVSITINAVNDPPVANNAIATTNENTPVNITISAGDIDSGILNFVIAAGPDHGTTSAGTGAMNCTAQGRGSTCTANVNYTPVSNYSGPDHFTFTASDGTATSSAATVSITVLHVNRPPSLNSIGDKTVRVGNTLIFTVSASDPDNDPLTYSVFSLPVNASFDTSTRTFSFTPAASQVGSLSLTFAVSDGKGGSVSETISIIVLPGLSVNIASPADGATVPSGLVIVRGAVEVIGPDVGVSVNGFPAAVNAGEWVVQLFLNPGVQTLTATASTIAGQQVNHTITVNVSAAINGVDLVASVHSGVAPLTISWWAANQTDRNLVAFEFDENGSGVFGPPTSSFDGIQIAYTTPGLYWAVLRATDDQGVTHTATALVNVEDPLVVRARFQATWTSLKDRLLAGDIQGALDHLTPSIRPRFEAAFQQLGGDLPAIAAGLGNIEVLEQLDDIAEAAIVQQENNSPMLYFIYYRRDILGRWLIEEM